MPTTTQLRSIMVHCAGGVVTETDSQMLIGRLPRIEKPLCFLQAIYKNCFTLLKPPIEIKVHTYSLVHFEAFSSSLSELNRVMSSPTHTHCFDSSALSDPMLMFVCHTHRM